jgi:hypothetical protein
MPSILKTTRVYLDDQRRGVITCVQCRTQTPMKISPEAGPVGGKTAKVQCRVCRSKFYVRFDSRRHHRRKTTLPGTLWPRGADAALGAITVTSLSAGGLSFLMAQPFPVQPGEVYEAVFTLNDKDQSIIRESIIIQRLEGLMVGAAFSSNEQYNYALDFYLGAFA